MRLIKASLTLVIGLSLLAVAPPTFAQDDVIKDRKRLMKSNDRNEKSIRKAVKEMDYAAIQSGAKKILANAGKIEALFPEGSMSAKSRATKAIWANQDGFKDNIGWLKNSVNALAAAAAAKDNDLVKLEAKAVNAACNQCHRSFRKSSRRAKKKK